MLLALSLDGFRNDLQQWAPAAEWGVAIGTIGLAAMTFKLARRAKEETEVVAKQFAVSQRTSRSRRCTGSSPTALSALECLYYALCHLGGLADMDGFQVPKRQREVTPARVAAPAGSSPLRTLSRTVRGVCPRRSATSAMLRRSGYASMVVLAQSLLCSNAEVQSAR